MRRIELEKSSVERIRLEGGFDLPDVVTLKTAMELESVQSIYEMTFEVPTWRLTDEDVQALRDMSFVKDPTVRVVLEVEE